MEHYDYILAGGGSAGLGLAYQLAHSPLGDRRILVIDQDAKEKNDRTWCSWLREPAPFDEIAHRVWHRLQVVSEEGAHVIDLAPYRYRLIRGIDFYRFTREALARRPNVRLRQGVVQDIRDGAERALVTVDGQTVSGTWVFDSLFTAETFQVDRSRYYDLRQHFKGWEIEARAPVFDPAVPSFFDFRTPQHDTMRFLYVLPFSERRALVEYTLFSAHLLEGAAYDAALRAYIGEVLGLGDYAILDEETGIIPMTDAVFPRRLGRRIMATGTRGGRVKASTGFAFARTQQDNAAIVRSLLQQGHPYDVPAAPGRFRLFDQMLLQIMYRHGGLSKPIFLALFEKNPIDRLFRLLDEEASWWDSLRVMASVPPWPFLRAWWHLKVHRP